MKATPIRSTSSSESVPDSTLLIACLSMTCLMTSITVSVSFARPCLHLLAAVAEGYLLRVALAVLWTFGPRAATQRTTL